MAEERGLAESVKDGLVGTIRGAGEVANAVTDVVSGTLVHAIKGTGAVGAALTGAVSDVVRGGVQGVTQIGGDVGEASKGALIGLLGRFRRQTTLTDIMPMGDEASGSPRGDRRWSGGGAGALCSE
jgi:hypothetical protein